MSDLPRFGYNRQVDLGHSVPFSPPFSPAPLRIASRRALVSKMAGVAINVDLFLQRLGRLHAHFVVSEPRQQRSSAPRSFSVRHSPMLPDPTHFRSCPTFLQANRSSEALYGGAHALLIQHGKAVTSDKEEPHAVSLQKHLAGYEFPETVFVLTADAFVVHASQKKRE